MNIFISDPSPIKSAIALDDKRVIKMTLESAQLLSNVGHSLGLDAPYKKTHYNHPVSVWARQSKENYQWLLTHFIALFTEYTKRFKKVHKCQQYYQVFKDYEYKLPNKGLTPFKNCTIMKDIKDVHLAYKRALVDKWANDKREPKWTNSAPPKWYSEILHGANKVDFKDEIEHERRKTT